MATKRRLRVGVLFGGRSAEHEISLRSALTVMSAMDARRYEVVPIGIDRDGRWHLRTDAIEMLRATTPRLAALDHGGTAVILQPHPDSHALIPAPQDGRASPAKRRTAEAALDVVFPVLHGPYGEDGTVQGLLELADLPYVGARVLGSAIGIDKDVQKRLLLQAGVPVVRYRAITRAQYTADAEIARSFADTVGYPVFVKPNALGSSVGITRVGRSETIAAAMREAFRYDRKVLVEAACIGREIECAVLGNDSPEASVPGEVVLKHGHAFYSYESKYVDPEGAEIRIPAALDTPVAARIRELAVAAFRALELSGMARVDFLASRDLSDIYVNEVNTIPGFTSISMYPKLWEASGLPLPALIDRLIELALESHRARAGLAHSYLTGPRPRKPRR